MMLPGSGNIFQSIEMIERGILRKINLKKDEKRVHFHLVSSSEGSDDIGIGNIFQQGNNREI